jgi:hypothetical protein
MTRGLSAIPETRRPLATRARSEIFARAKRETLAGPWDQPQARWLARLREVAATGLSLLRMATGKPRARPLAKLPLAKLPLAKLPLAEMPPAKMPLAKIKARPAALGFPHRRDPVPAPVKPDRDCDCVPWCW